jgi:glycosyltransferase involved in cell wall biosynthesis
MGQTSRVICVMGRVLDQEDGLGVYAQNLLHTLARIDASSRYVILLRTPRHVHSFRDLPNVECRILRAPLKLWWDQKLVACAARSCGADLIFNPKFSLPLLSRRPGIMVLHGSEWYVHPQNYQWWDRLYIRALMPLYARKAHRLLAISQQIQDDLARYAGVERAKVTVTYAAPSPQFRPDAGQGQAARAIPPRHALPGGFMLAVARVYHTGHPGRLPYPGGNVEGLLRGYRTYRRSGGRLPLVVVGRDVREFLRQRGLRNQDLENVWFPGFVPHAQIQHAYGLAEFFVLTTLYESFSLPIVEAMACGCPVIAPTSGACPEIAGDAARLVDPLDSDALGAAMHLLATRPDERERLRRLGRERAARFTWRSVAERTVAVFDEAAPRADRLRATG